MPVNMKEMLTRAREGRYGIGFFNAVNVEMARAIIETAEELRAPVIVGTAEILLPAMPLERVAEYLVPMAEKASVPVAVHYDHGLTFGKCMEALKLGFTSVMYDCSTAPYEENLARVAEMVRICHAMGATVEGELGHVGDNEGAGKRTSSGKPAWTRWPWLSATPMGITNFRRNWTLTGSPRSGKRPGYPWCCTEAADYPTMISGRRSAAASARSTSSPTWTRPGKRGSKRVCRAEQPV